MNWACERATSDPLLRLSIPCDIVLTDGHGMGPREGVGDWPCWVTCVQQTVDR